MYTFIPFMQKSWRCRYINFEVPLFCCFFLACSTNISKYTPKQISFSVFITFLILLFIVRLQQNEEKNFSMYPTTFRTFFFIFPDHQQLYKCVAKLFMKLDRYVQAKIWKELNLNVAILQIFIYESKLVVWYKTQSTDVQKE